MVEQTYREELDTSEMHWDEGVAREGQEEDEGEDDVEKRRKQDKLMTGATGLLEMRIMMMPRMWAVTRMRLNTEGVNWDKVENDGDDEYDSVTMLSQRTRS